MTRRFPPSAGYPLALIALVLTGACSAPDDQRRANEAAAMVEANSIDAHMVAGHESSPHD